MRNLIGHLRAITTALKYLFLKPMTVKYPEVILKKSDNYRGIIILNTEKCIHCTLCARICPAAAIKMYKHEDGKLYPGFDYSRCIFCGFCIDICPSFALSHDKFHELVVSKLEEAKVMYSQTYEFLKKMREKTKEVEPRIW